MSQKQNSLHYLTPIILNASTIFSKMQKRTNNSEFPWISAVTSKIYFMTALSNFGIDGNHRLMRLLFRVERTKIERSEFFVKMRSFLVDWYGKYLMFTIKIITNLLYSNLQNIWLWLPKNCLSKKIFLIVTHISWWQKTVSVLQLPLFLLLFSHFKKQWNENADSQKTFRGVCVEIRMKS